MPVNNTTNEHCHRLLFHALDLSNLTKEQETLCFLLAGLSLVRNSSADSRAPYLARQVLCGGLPEVQGGFPCVRAGTIV